jgi:hypothetical protein
MSEYQYYEFQAIDRLLSAEDRDALRAISTRGQITASSFTNTYHWGDFKGDPTQLMENWFDLHLYQANWGTRTLMIRLPARLVDRERLQTLLGDADFVEFIDAGENLILDITQQEVDSDYRDEESSSLAAMVPLRADVLAGDLRLFYLLWLMATEEDEFGPDECEPLPGIGPLTAAHEAFAEFFAIDHDLIEAAAERADPTLQSQVSPDAAQTAIAALTDEEKTTFLMRLYNGETHLGVELHARIRQDLTSESNVPPVPLRTISELRERAEAIAQARARAQAAAAAAKLKRQEAEAARLRRARMDDLIRRGETVWTEVETEIARRNAPGYDRAAELLSDLQAIADESDKIEDFAQRLATIRERHSQKQRFIDRLKNL